MNDFSSTPNAHQMPIPFSAHKRKMARVLAILLVVGVVSAGIALAFVPWGGNQHHGISVQVPVADSGGKIAAMNAHMDDIDKKLDVIAARLSTLTALNSVGDTAGKTAESDVDVAALKQDVATLSATVKSLAESVKDARDKTLVAQQLGQETMAISLAYLQLREAVKSGAAYGDALDRFIKAAQGHEDLLRTAQKLSASAPMGISSGASLREQFLASEAEAYKAVRLAAATAWWKKLLLRLEGLILIRSVNDNHFGSAQLALIETALAGDDVRHALDVYAQLPQEAQTVLADWQAKATARVEVEAALDSLASALLAPISPAVNGKAMP